jgi:hypothetical protein
VCDALEHTRGDPAREPEVLYFGAVVAYKSTGKAEHLKEGWDRLLKEFPESDLGEEDRVYPSVRR